MATFKVGQRVRIVEALADLLGKTATIWGAATAQGDWLLDIDGIGTNCPETGSRWAAYSYQIVPLQSQRNRVVAWEDCPFDPRKIAELV